MKTLTGPASWSEEIRHSRFFVNAGRADSQADSLAFFEQVRKADASHNCWAFRIGQSHRFSDDGEPASTAGKPILAAIDGQGLDHIMVVVSRYFGGTKLGIGGLIRAYGGSAARCLQLASIVELAVLHRYRLQVPFDRISKVHQLLNELGAKKDSEDYQPEGVTLRIRISRDQLQPLQQSLADITRGKARIRKLAD